MDLEAIEGGNRRVLLIREGNVGGSGKDSGVKGGLTNVSVPSPHTFLQSRPSAFYFIYIG